MLGLEPQFCLASTLSLAVPTAYIRGSWRTSCCWVGNKVCVLCWRDGPLCYESLGWSLTAQKGGRRAGSTKLSSNIAMFVWWTHSNQWNGLRALWCVLCEGAYYVKEAFRTGLREEKWVWTTLLFSNWLNSQLQCKGEQGLILNVSERLLGWKLDLQVMALLGGM